MARRHRRKWSLAAATVTSLASLVAPLDAQQAAPMPAGWRAQGCAEANPRERAVWGVVHDALRQPLEGVQVYVPGTGCGIISDEEGRYGLTGLAAGAIALRADRIGYQSDSIQLTSYEAATRIDFKLAAGRGQESMVYVAEAGPSWVPREVAARVVGCYSIDVSEAYGPPIRPYGGPWETRPAGFLGLPSAILVDTFAAGGDSITLVAHTLSHGEAQDAARADQTDPHAWFFGFSENTVSARWTGSPNIWWIRYRLVLDGDSLAGVSWYESHEPGGTTEQRETTWRRARCWP